MMGASPYFYFVHYEVSIQDALDKLRQREFEAGAEMTGVDLPLPRTTEQIVAAEVLLDWKRY